MVIVNPLGASLAHYVGALEGLLQASGVAASTLTILEPSASGRSRIRWLAEYVWLLVAVRARHKEALVVVAWPVLGYWDFAITRILLGAACSWIVMHDPVPLNRAHGPKGVGHGRCARRLAGSKIVDAAAILHSQEALRAIQRCTRLRRRIVLPLPMCPPRHKPVRTSNQVTVRVLGQYKADRDLGILERLALATENGSRYEIVGRGWGAVPGWKTIDRFVSERELIELIQTSDVIVIPYRRFFQSDIAVRSLEWGTPIVGPRESSLASLVGTDSGWLATDDWVVATKTAINAGKEEVFKVATTAYERARTDWMAWLTTTLR